MDKNTPVIRNLRSLFKERLPQEQVILHMAEDEWKKLSKGIPTSRRKIGKDAKGLFVMPDGFGGYLGAFACAAGSQEGVACIPEIVNSGGTIIFGGGCICISGKDPLDPPVVFEPASCSLGISPTGGFTCTGTCVRGKRCRLVKAPVGPGGRVLITCECS